ncbi:hypothetical protein P7K49_037135 [Saguinus oedipus]|uniref:Secreted protein n=1 Tax=Saguinus oedipus TaxID=9490 RepID=A0ABQ9TH81_SAGOE|nr:hypothetical protein P7K49_037135 [Saguinus oedipus]
MDVYHTGIFLVASVTPALAVTDGSFIWPPVNSCELHCQPSNEYFAEKLRDAVIDGTPCYQGRAARTSASMASARDPTLYTTKAKPLPGLLALEIPPSQALLLCVSLDAVPALLQPGKWSPGRGLTSCQLADPR